MIDDSYDEIVPLLLDKQNVCGTATGVKWVDGKPTDEPAVLVFVQEKMTEANVLAKHSLKDIIPQRIDGIAVDVLEVGDLKKQNFTGKVRPLVAGYSCGHANTTAGTMGGFFVDKQNEVVMLSNNHVVSNENRATLGDPVYQPGPADSRQRSLMGKLKDFVRLENNGNLHDSGIVAIDQDIIRQNLIDNLYPNIQSPLRGIGEAQINLPVQKFGRTTGHTFGNVIGLNGRFRIGFDIGALGFIKCIVMTAMSKGGDSGSLILDMDMNMVGLLFAGSDRVTLANPIQPVLDHYGLSIWKPDGENQSGWRVVSSSGSVSESDGSFAINEHANHFSFVERALVGRTNSVACDVNTGTDKGATWGPGIGLQFRNGFLAVNLRYLGGFGGYINSQQLLNVGSTREGQSYGVRIRRSNNTWVGQVRDGDRWFNVLTVPHSVLHGEPISVRIGKFGPEGLANNYHVSGPKGDCHLSNIRILS